MGVGGWRTACTPTDYGTCYIPASERGGLLHSAGALCACMLGSASGRFDRGNTEEAAQFFLSSNKLSLSSRPLVLNLSLYTCKMHCCTHLTPIRRNEATQRERS